MQNYPKQWPRQASISMTDDQVLIKADNVSKKFCRSLKRSMMYGLKDIARDTFGISPDMETVRKDEFWAVKDVSFQLKRGECLGIIGPNGAGKSTLLKMLNGIILPDTGRITVKGRVGALIEIGAGFHPMLTGRENIYINGSILGLSRKEINKKFDNIVAFAELEQFIDTPVKHYSSGMYVRLGFAIAAQMEPDVLILDEVLAVGDVSFQAHCFNAIYNMMRNSAVLFVSHAMHQVSRICSDLLVLQAGQRLFFGKEVGKGIDLYFSQCTHDQACTVSGSGRAQIHSVDLEVNSQPGKEVVEYGDNLVLHSHVTIDPDIHNPGIGFTFFAPDTRIVAQCISHFNRFRLTNNGKRMVVRVDLGSCLLNPGIYWLTVSVQEHNLGEILARYSSYQKIKVTGWFQGSSPIQIEGHWTAVECSSTRAI